MPITSKKVKKFISKTSNRHKMLDQCGSKAFLDSKNLAFPVTTGNCEINCGMVYSAYLRAKQWHKDTIATKAKNLYKTHGCEKKINKKIKEDIQLDIYTNSFQILESNVGNFAGNSYIISTINDNALDGTLSEMYNITESFNHKSINSVNAVNKAIPIVLIEFDKKSDLKNSLVNFISEQKKIMENNILIPVKGTMYNDSEYINALNTNLRESFENFLSNASYVSVMGQFQENVNEMVDNIVDALTESSNYIITGVV